MRVAMFVGKFPILSETFIINQITGLIDRGHDVDIFAYNQDRFDPSQFHNAVHTYNLEQRIVNFPQITSKSWRNILKFCRLYLTVFAKNPLYALKFFNIFRYGKGGDLMQTVCYACVFLGRKPYDIVHCQFGTNGLKALSILDVPALKNAKLVTTFRGFDISKAIKQEGADIYDELFQQGNFFLTNCDHFKEKLIRLGCNRSKIRVLRSGINHRDFQFTDHATKENGPVRLVSVGRFVEKKGIEYSIRAVTKTFKTNKNITYSLVGYGPLEKDLKQLVDELDANTYIHFLGQKRVGEIIDILRQSQIFLASSVTAESGDEDGPVNTIKEALCLGLPVIATDHGGIPELIQNGVSGLLVPERDSDAIAEGIDYYLAHPEVWAPMARAGRAIVEQHYDLEKLNDRLVAYYEELVKP